MMNHAHAVSLTFVNIRLGTLRGICAGDVLPFKYSLSSLITSLLGRLASFLVDFFLFYFNWYSCIKNFTFHDWEDFQQLIDELRSLSITFTNEAYLYCCIFDVVLDFFVPIMNQKWTIKEQQLWILKHRQTQKLIVVSWKAAVVIENIDNLVAGKQKALNPCQGAPHHAGLHCKDNRFVKELEPRPAIMWPKMDDKGKWSDFDNLVFAKLESFTNSKEVRFIRGHCLQPGYHSFWHVAKFWNCGKQKQKN